MPAAPLVAGAAVGIAVDRLLEERPTALVPPPVPPQAWRRDGSGRRGGHDLRTRGPRGDR